MSYLHALEGRVRLKVPEVKGSPARARALERQFRPLAPLEHVSANHVTGNVLILFDPRGTSIAEIVEALHAIGYLRELPSRSEGPGGNGHWSNVVLRATTELALQRLITALI